MALTRAGIASVAIALATSGCSRTGLGELGLVDGTEPGPVHVTPMVDAGTGAGGAPVVSVPDAAAGGSSTPVKESTSPTHGHVCVPTSETCNGLDDDCNGKVDDGLPAIPCEGGGEQYCVAGRYSACPVRCETCIPGSERVCFLSYCTFWASETCAADGRSFGTCKEGHVPPECASVSDAHKDSAELEQCCIDTGHCCHDEFDLDGDGDHDEMLGRCDEVSCHP